MFYNGTKEIGTLLPEEMVVKIHLDDLTKIGSVFLKVWFKKPVLERTHFLSNSSFIELQKFQFKHIVSSSFFHFSSLSSSLETSLPRFGLNISSISSFINFEFA